MAIGVALLLAVVAFSAFLLIALEELPVSWNAARVARQWRRRFGRTNDWPSIESRVGRQTRLGAWVLLLFGVGAAVVTAVGTAPRVGDERASYLAVGIALTLGLFVLGAAFLFLAPKLLVQVRRLLEAEAATANFPPRDTEPPHGRGPRLS